MILKPFVIQWHLLPDCDYSCSYCYLKKFKIKQIVDWELIFEVIKKFKEYRNDLTINLTGGDPFYHKDIDAIIRKLDSNDIKINILGNPITEQTKPIIERNAKFINNYQLSFDGYGNGHKNNRGDQKIYRIWDSISELNKLRIKTNIMFTLSRINKDEIIEAFQKTYNQGIYYFSFSRLVPTSRSNFKEMLDKAEMKIVLNEIFDFLVEHDNYNLDFKENLWKLMFFENQLYKPNANEISGCGIGYSSFSIMPDGNIYPCSRLPIQIGNIKNDALSDLLETNPLLTKFRDKNQYEKCKHCELVEVCRGCPAISYAITGSPFNSDPQCWKN
jgi:radical SAM protein with 4Fe4S-binding SPASM domain